MRRLNLRFPLGPLTAVLSLALSGYAVTGTELLLTWRDNSKNEDGFYVERSFGSLPYEVHAKLARNVTSFAGLVESSEPHCYRVRAFNAAGFSGFTNEACAYTLIVDHHGAGTGKITAPGLNCPPDCSEAFAEHETVSLDAQPAEGSLFTGWGGDADCMDGVVTLESTRTCIATFEQRAQGTPVSETKDPAPESEEPDSGAHVLLTVVRAFEVSEHGASNGHVASQPAGIDCGSACSARYEGSAVVTLRALAATDSEFAGWTGANCPNTGPCTVELTQDTSVVANFAPRTVVLTVTPPQRGVIAGAGIDCGSICQATYRFGTKVTLQALPEAAFSEWVNTGCADLPECELTLESDQTATARFNVRSRIGVFRPATGEWFLDSSGTGDWQRARRIDPWDPSQVQGVPLAGSWTRENTSSLGIYDATLQKWYLDNGNDRWEGCGVDICATFAPSAAPGAKPVVGEWHLAGRSDIGLFHASTGSWYFDNGNHQWDGCERDLCYAGEDIEIIRLTREIEAFQKQFTELNVELRTTNDKHTKKQLKRARKMAKKQLKRARKRLKKYVKSLKKAARKRGRTAADESVTRAPRIGQQDTAGVEPVVALFRNGGPVLMGAFYTKTGAWEFDANENRQWDGCGVDSCVPDFSHQAGDIPVVGDWDGAGVSKLGIFRAARGQWLLDMNGNARWDGCEIDACLGPFGSEGDLPVVGEW